MTKAEAIIRLAESASRLEYAARNGTDRARLAKLASENIALCRQLADLIAAADVVYSPPMSQKRMRGIFMLNKEQFESFAALQGGLRRITRECYQLPLTGIDDFTRKRVTGEVRL